MNENKKFDVVARWKLYVIIPSIFFVISAILAIVFTPDISIEFRGGTMLTYSYTGNIDTNAVADNITGTGKSAVRVDTGSAFNSDLTTITISFASNDGLTTDVQSEITSSLNEQFAENNLDLINSQDVSPSTGSMFFLKCLVAVTVAFIFLIIYIAFRFKKIGGWSAGVFALVALITDVFMVMASFVFFRLEIDVNFMVVILTVLGYSLNNTIIIYDRIRENRTLLGNKISYRELVNISTRQSLTRTINTTVATGLAVIVICIVAYAFGVDSIISFAFPLLVGLVSGIFSSLLLVGPLWVVWQEYKNDSKGKLVKG